MGLAVKIPADAGTEPVEKGDLAEIVVHISDELDELQQQALISMLYGQHGIVDAKTAELRGHVMVAKFDRQSMSSQDAINAYKAMKLDASCIVSVK
jgi:hypothetical protein